MPEAVHHLTVETIREPLENMPRLPNLLDWKEAYRKFSWEDWRGEIDWFEGGKLNAAFNAVDRHAESAHGGRAALRWKSADGCLETYSFEELKTLTNRFANALKSLGVRRGDRVFLFLPRLPEVPICFLGTLKTGAVAGTLFCAFGPEALRDRLGDSAASVVITTPDLKDRIDQARPQLPHLRTVIVLDNRGEASSAGEGEAFYSELMAGASDIFKIEEMDPTDYAFILYTSGTTGKPKGIVHTHGGILQQHLSTKWVLDLQAGDIYWCTADHGWVTGICYGILGPLSNGITVVTYEGRFDADQWFSFLQDEAVTVWYTAPTAVRMLMQAGDNPKEKFDLSKLRAVYSVGEPLNPEAVRWGMKAIGLPIRDTWWQTETGSILIGNLACNEIRLGSMGLPFPGVQVGILDEEGREMPPMQEGNLAIRSGWPSQLATVWGNEERFQAYFKGSWFITGDRAYVDADGYVWFVARADDVIKTAGERVGPFEVESALIEHPAVVEAGVIGKPDPVRGQIIKAFVVLSPGWQPSDELSQVLKEHVKQFLAGHAYPKEIEYVPSLPKTRSGKIMRRLLKAKELGEELGDLSTLED